MKWDDPPAEKRCLQIQQLLLDDLEMAKLVHHPGPFVRKHRGQNGYGYNIIKIIQYNMV